MAQIDNLIKTLNLKISKQYKMAFMSAILFGLVAHVYMFTNKLPNYDDLRTLDGFGTTFASGRWFLWIIGAVAWHLDFVFSLSWINGLITLIFIALSAGVIVDILGLKSNISCILTGAALVVFPSWVGSMFFMFIVPYFAVAFFMSVMSVYLHINYKYGWIASVMLLACSMGIYQAYLPFVATLYVVILLLKIFVENEDYLSILKSAVGYLINIVIGVGVYFVITKLSLAITGQELTKTKGIDTMGQFDIGRISSIFQTIIKNTYDIFTGNDLEISYNYATKLMYLVLTLCVVYYLVRLIIRQIRGKDYCKCVLTIVLIIAYEIAINGIFIMCEEGIYVLMYYSYVFLMIFPICIIEHCTTWKHSKVTKILEYCVVLALVIGIASYCHFANAQYLSLELSYEQAKSYCTTLVTQIKSVDGYSDELPVVFVGQDISDETLYKNDVMDRLMFSGREETLVEAYSREYLLRYYCGFNPIYASSEDVSANVIEDMPTYPKDGSIKVIYGTVVVRFE